MKQRVELYLTVRIPAVQGFPAVGEGLTETASDSWDVTTQSTWRISIAKSFLTKYAKQLIWMSCLGVCL
jgi:hypothetical protein